MFEDNISNSITKTRNKTCYGKNITAKNTLILTHIIYSKQLYLPQTSSIQKITLFYKVMIEK